MSSKITLLNILFCIVFVFIRKKKRVMLVRYDRWKEYERNEQVVKQRKKFMEYDILLGELTYEVIRTPYLAHCAMSTTCDETRRERELVVKDTEVTSDDVIFEERS